MPLFEILAVLALVATLATGVFILWKSTLYGTGSARMMVRSIWFIWNDSIDGIT